MNHVKNTTEESKSWCGKDLDISFHFKDTEQAVINGLHGDKQICGGCIDIIVENLIRNDRDEL
jgi:hypothetical protein